MGFMGVLIGNSLYIDLLVPDFDSVPRNPDDPLDIIHGMGIRSFQMMIRRAMLL
jgi:hypothetical protein